MEFQAMNSSKQCFPNLVMMRIPWKGLLKLQIPPLQILTQEVWGDVQNSVV